MIWLIRRTAGEGPEILAARETWAEIEEYMQQTARLYGFSWAYDLYVIEGTEFKIQCEETKTYSFLRQR